MRVEALPRMRQMVCAGLLVLGLAGGSVHAQVAAEATMPGVAAPLGEDPALEARVKAFSYNLRCLVCQNETIADSRAPLAVDLRNQVKAQFEAGKSDDEVRSWLVDRYGDFVLYTPPMRASTWLLWFGPGLLLLCGAGWLLYRLRSRQSEAPVSLSEEERARARALLEGSEAQPEESRK